MNYIELEGLDGLPIRLEFRKFKALETIDFVEDFLSLAKGSVSFDLQGVANGVLGMGNVSQEDSLGYLKMIADVLMGVADTSKKKERRELYGKLLRQVSIYLDENTKTEMVLGDIDKFKNPLALYTIFFSFLKYNFDFLVKPAEKKS